LIEGEPENDHRSNAELLRAHVTGDPDPVEIKEPRSVVAEALSTLNAEQRTALVLVDMEGYSVEEAAQILGRASGTVKSRCARGRALLLPLLIHLKAEEGS
jgi:RNA polymerase sigma-70 factor, ECF subfamily